MLALVTALAAAQSVPDRVTVPLRVEKNRPFIMVTLHRVDGTRRTAKFLVDTGGGGFLITEAVARDGGLEWGTPSKEGGSQFAVVKKAPAAFVGAFPLAFTPARTLVLHRFGQRAAQRERGSGRGHAPRPRTLAVPRRVRLPEVNVHAGAPRSTHSAGRCVSDARFEADGLSAHRAQGQWRQVRLPARHRRIVHDGL